MIYNKFHKTVKVCSLFFALFTLSLSLSAEDIRTKPLDMFLILDGSEALKSGKDQAVQWLCDYVVDGLLREGDRVTLWAAGDRAKRIFSETIAGPDTKEGLKTAIRSITAEAAVADYRGALREAAGLTTGEDTRITYTLMINGTDIGKPSLTGDTVELVRYSRIREYPGWRVMVVGLGIGPQVRKAASAYLN
jgi:hypothetical protein